MERNIEQLAQKAKDGDKEALERLVIGIHGDIYGLSLRMLGFVNDTEDATQEILIKIITHLSTFRGESSFKTWSYRIAVNHLFSLKKTHAQKMNISFDSWEEMGHRSDPSFDYDSLPKTDKLLLTEEARIGCMQGMLQCLDKKVRIAVILGELFEMTSEEGAVILGITPAAFRKRLSRGRYKLVDFMQNNCSLVNSNNPCHCSKMVGPDIRDKWIDPDNLQFAGSRCRAKIDQGIKDRLEELDEISRVVELFHSYPGYEGPPESIVNLVKEMIISREYEIINQ